MAKRHPLDTTLVEELTDDGWKPYQPSSWDQQPDGEYNVTIRVRTKKGPTRVPDKTIAKLADELYDAWRHEPYKPSEGSPYDRLIAACGTRRR